VNTTGTRGRVRRHVDSRASGRQHQRLVLDGDQLDGFVLDEPPTCAGNAATGAGSCIDKHVVLQQHRHGTYKHVGRDRLPGEVQRGPSGRRRIRPARTTRSASTTARRSNERRLSSQADESGSRYRRSSLDRNGGLRRRDASTGNAERHRRVRARAVARQDSARMLSWHLMEATLRLVSSCDVRRLPCGGAQQATVATSFSMA